MTEKGWATMTVAPEATRPRLMGRDVRRRAIVASDEAVAAGIATRSAPPLLAYTQPQQRRFAHLDDEPRHADDKLDGAGVSRRQHPPGRMGSMSVGCIRRRDAEHLPAGLVVSSARRVRAALSEPRRWLG